jgi:hypothetical protein
MTPRARDSARVSTLIANITANGEVLDGPDLASELVMITHHAGFMIPALAACKARDPPRVISAR